MELWGHMGGRQMMKSLLTVAEKLLSVRFDSNHSKAVSLF